MSHVELTWSQFKKLFFSMIDKDLECIHGTEIWRGPVVSLAYNGDDDTMEVGLGWAARLGSKGDWLLVYDENEGHSFRLSVGVFRLIKWSDGRVSMDSAENPLAPTYVFLAKEACLDKPDKSF